MASETPQDGRNGDDRWFEVDSPIEVVDRTGTPIGRLQPGRRYRALDVTALQVVVPGPGGSSGYVARSAVRLLADAPVEPPAAPVQNEAPTTRPTPPPQPTARAIADPPSAPAAPARPAPAPPAPASPAPTTKPPRGGWTRWAVPVLAVVVVAGAAVWLAIDNADSNEAADDSELAEGVAASNGDTAGSPAQNDAPAADDPATGPLEPVVDTAAADPGAHDDNAVPPDPNDLAGGALAFRVVEGSPVEVPNLLISGYSSQFAFGFDVTRQADVAIDAIVIDRVTRQEVARLPTGTGFVSEVLDRGTEVWLAVANERKIIVFDPACVCVSREVPITSTIVNFLFEHEGRIWAGDYDGSIDTFVVSVIDPPTGQIVAQIPIKDAGASADHLSAPVLVGDRIWIGDIEEVWIIDPATLTVAGRVEVGGSYFLTVLGHAGSVFATDRSQGSISAVNPTDSSVRRVAIADRRTDGQLLISEPVIEDRSGLIWVSSTEADGALVGVDPVTLEVVHRIPLDGTPGPPAISRGLVWVPVGDRLVVVNPETGLIVVELPGVGPVRSTSPFNLEVVDNALWLLPFGSSPGRTYLLEAS